MSFEIIGIVYKTPIAQWRNSTPNYTRNIAEKISHRCKKEEKHDLDSISIETATNDPIKSKTKGRQKSSRIKSSIEVKKKGKRKASQDIKSNASYSKKN